MKSVIPFSKEIVFKTNIAEISSISLEHNYDVVNNAIKGEFVVTGEYKSHELSVNKEDFKYSLPFSIDIDDDIDLDSVKMEIEDFTYDFKGDILEVKIEYSLIGERIKEERKEIIMPLEEEVEDPSDFLKEANELLEEREIKEEPEIKEESEIKENVRENAILSEVIKTQEDIVEIDDNNIVEENIKEDIKDSTAEKSEYVTYHVHILKEEETIETVCKLYNVNMSLIEEYNDISNIGPKDKIIIPIYQDE